MVICFLVPLQLRDSVGMKSVVIYFLDPLYLTYSVRLKSVVMCFLVPLQLKDNVGLKSVGSRLGHLIKVLSTSELRSLTFENLGLACSSTDTLDVQVTDVQVRRRRLGIYDI